MAVMPPPPPPTVRNVNATTPQQIQNQKIQQYNEHMRQQNSNARMIPQNINKFSPAYSRIIAAKPKAGKSANIRLGGLY
jgi:hypothetical protein